MPPSASTPVICATARLARGLRLAHDRAQLAAGLRQWPTLPALTLSQWLDGIFDEALLSGSIAAAMPRSLSPLQERMLWERAIADSLTDDVIAALFDRAGMASAAQEANRLLVEQCAMLEAGQAHTDETQHFLVWRERFQALCRESNCLEPARYLDWQITQLQAGSGELPSAIRLAGFERMHPQLQRLLDVLRERGVAVDHQQTAVETVVAVRHISLADREAECRAVVAWAAERLAQNPQAQLAIVVPELAQVCQQLAALLDETLHPLAAAPAFAEMPRLYDFSLGEPLAVQPVVAAALALLRLALQPRASQTEFSALLLQPYWSASLREADARAQLDARMREWLPLTVSLQRLLRFAQRMQEGERALQVMRLAQDLAALAEAAGRQPRRQLPSAWVEAVQHLLRAAQWPGERSLSSHEYQARKAFDRALQSLAAFDGLVPAMNAGEALRCLEQICREQIFQPEVANDPPLQVMGMLETPAEPFAAVWVMGMNDHVWPPPPRPNPLLPVPLQRALRMPNADSAVQADFAADIHARLLASAADVTFSSALKDGDRDLRASPLMDGLPIETQPVPLAATLAERLSQGAPQRLRTLPDHLAPPVAEGERISGGTGLLKAQAICPAWAYYQYRLGARALKAPLDGLEPTERGTLVHGTLEFFWQHPELAEGQAALRSLTPSALEMRVLEAADAALARFIEQRYEPLSPAFLALERERLSRLVRAWLAVEAERPQPFRVQACEQEHKLDIDGVEIRLVLDRIDRLADERLVLMDYKTGLKPDTRSWAEARICEPQLPVYAALSLADHEVAAVCFAMVRAEEHGFSGIAAETELLSGVSGLDDARARKLFTLELFPHWQALLAHWKTCTENIVRELKAGEAAVRFSDDKLLAYCEVLPLLRLPERRLLFERRQAATEDAS